MRYVVGVTFNSKAFIPIHSDCRAYILNINSGNRDFISGFDNVTTDSITVVISVAVSRSRQIEHAPTDPHEATVWCMQPNCHVKRHHM
jgi:hypothetical protein